MKQHQLSPYYRERVIEYEAAFSATRGIMDDYDLSREDQYVSMAAVQQLNMTEMAEHQEVLQRFATSTVERVRPALIRIQENHAHGHHTTLGQEPRLQWQQAQDHKSAKGQQGDTG